jgi:serine phosphatase RsbU (regulator of sigma subunit)
LTFANAGHPSPILVTRSGCAFLSDSPGDLPLGVFPRHHSAEYVVALPADALVALYTDGITEHNRNIIEGELELTSACRHVYEHGPRNDARAIAEHVLRRGRGRDDAAIVALRTTPARTSAR